MALFKTFGERVRAARQNKNWTLTQLAGDAELSKGFVSDLENNKRDPSLSTLQSLSRSLQVSIQWLVEGRPIPEMKCPLCKGSGVL